MTTLGVPVTSRSRVYRVTAADIAAVHTPCVLVVGFRLRRVHGFGHTVFRAESILNTPHWASPTSATGGYSS